MHEFPQSENFRGGIMTSEYSRIAKRKYHEVADDMRIAKGWKKSELAERARHEFPELGVTNEQVYEWLEGGADPRTSFSKVMEFTLGINLPPQCYYNAGKR